MEVLTVITRRAQLEFSNGCWKVMENNKNLKGKRLSFDGGIPSKNVPHAFCDIRIGRLREIGNLFEAHLLTLI